MLLPYKEERADYIIESIKKAVYKLVSETVNTQISYTGRKLSTFFKLKDKSKFDYQHDLVYHAKYPSELCDENYIGESGRRIAESVKDHIGRNHKSHILKDSLETGHGHVISSDFSIIFKNFNGKKGKRKIVQSVLIKQLRPTLNIHDRSVPLKLFN